MRISEVIFAVVAAGTITLAYIGLFHVLMAFGQIVDRRAARRRASKIGSAFLASEPAARLRIEQAGSAE